MRKKSAIGITALICFVAAGFFLYSNFVGFERESLARKLPVDTYASLSLRHVRKLGIAFATDEQLRASAQVVQALAKILGDSLPSIDFSGVDTDIDDALLLSLSKHFKTQLTLAMLPPHSESGDSPEWAILSDFFGENEDFEKTLLEISAQASTPKLSFQWTENSWQGIPFQSLSLSASSDRIDFSKLDLSWAIYDETLYLCSHRDSLKKLLAHAQSKKVANVRDLLQAHDIDSHVPSADLTLFVNSKPCLELLTDSLQKRLISSGGLAATFNPSNFAQALNLDNIESLALAVEFTGNRTLYSGIRYKPDLPLLASLEASHRSIAAPPPNTPIFASETLNIDAGDVLLQLKSAFLKAAPLANFPYFGLRSQIQTSSGLDLETVLANSFSPRVTSSYTVDFGVGRNRFGEAKERVVFDSAFKFKLSENSQLATLVDSQKSWLLDSPTLSAYEEDNTLYIDRENDVTLTADRFALSFSDNYLTIGFGTLKSFTELCDRAELLEQSSETVSSDTLQVGNGSMTTSKLPTALFQLASVLYQQVNNTSHIPQAFLDFDWGSLTILEQNRISTTYLSADGHLFRISSQVD